MPRRHRRQPDWIVEPVAAPDHMQIGPQQQQIAAVDLACTRVGDIENREWRGNRLDDPIRLAAVATGH